MIASMISQHEISPIQFPKILKKWRQLRGESQLSLALSLGSSQRHLSFLESGRSHPSREMVNTLCEGLNIPLRDRNQILISAGFAPTFLESPIESDALEFANRALSKVLLMQDPMPAICFDPFYNIKASNKGAAKLLDFLREGTQVTFGPNHLLNLLDRDGFGRFVENFEEVASLLLKRLDLEAKHLGYPPEALALLEQIEMLENTPPNWRKFSNQQRQQPFTELKFVKDSHVLTFFSTITIFGAPCDVTLQDIRIESYFPSDEATKQFFE